jgi:hypothetical protein
MNGLEPLIKHIKFLVLIVIALVARPALQARTALKLLLRAELPIFAPLIRRESQQDVSIIKSKTDIYGRYL